MKDAHDKTANAKIDSIQEHMEDPEGSRLTTNQGVRISNNQDTLKAGERGPALMEDFIFREKLTHFDHERIPERIVHARGSAAHGVFQVYEPLGEFTKAKFLQDPTAQTPVFVRFSTVVGFRGSADTVRDARGFATKFYTEEGNFDLVGNNIPIFFIQDAIKFPDLVHAVKPEPHNEIPQASAAHDNFWDFISLMPESMHMVMWVLSDRGVPRSYRMMEGFGVHTFRLINADGKSRFVKFHWKPLLGVHARPWDEMQVLAGKDPDVDRRDLWDAIEAGEYPEYELGLQIVEEEQAAEFEFDLLDATKIIPEELVPVRRVGKMTLNRNPDNFFAETEQAAFHVGHIVPGIDFTNDPLLQGRLFSYLDTQLIRLGGPNFAEIPVNRPLAPVHNNQRDGFMRQTINKGRVNYEPNSLGNGCPMQSPEAMAAFMSHPEHMEGPKVRHRSESFADHFTQATLFWNSQSEVEQKHIVDALHFELGNVSHMHIRERMVRLLANVDRGLAERAAAGIGVREVNDDLSYLAESSAPQPNDRRGAAAPGRSAALSMEHTVKDSIRTRRVGVLLSDGFDHEAYETVERAITDQGGVVETVGKLIGTVKCSKGHDVEVSRNFATTASVKYDAVFIPGGHNVSDLVGLDDAVMFVKQAYKHCKAIAATGQAVDLLQKASVAEVSAGDAKKVTPSRGVVFGPSEEAESLSELFIQAIAQHRHWERELSS